MASFASAAREDYKAGMWVCANFHGIIYKGYIFNLITKRFRIEMSSDIDDYGFHPPEKAFDYIASNTNGSQMSIDSIKAEIRNVERLLFQQMIENEEFTKIIQIKAEEFTQTISEHHESTAMKFFIDLYKKIENDNDNNNEKRKRKVDKIEYSYCEILNELLDKNIIHAPEIEKYISANL